MNRGRPVVDGWADRLMVALAPRTSATAASDRYRVFAYEVAAEYGVDELGRIVRQAEQHGALSRPVTPRSRP